MSQKRKTKKVNTHKKIKRQEKKTGISINSIIMFIIYVALGVFVFLSDKDYCGPVGMIINRTLLSLFGTFGHYFYILLFVMAISFLINIKNKASRVFLFLLYIFIILFVSAYINNIDYSNIDFNNIDVWKIVQIVQEMIRNSYVISNKGFSAGIISTVINYYLFQLINRAGILVVHGFFVVLFFLLSFGMEGIQLIKELIVGVFLFIPNMIFNRKKIRREDIRINIENERKLNELIQRKEREKQEKEKFVGNITAEELKAMGIDAPYNPKDYDENRDNDINNSNIDQEADEKLIQMNEDLNSIKILDSSKLVYDAARIDDDVERMKSRFFRLNDLDNNNDYNNETEKKHKLLNQLKEKSINEINQANKDLRPADYFYDKTNISDKDEVTEKQQQKGMTNIKDDNGVVSSNKKISSIEDGLSDEEDKNTEIYEKSGISLGDEEIVDTVDDNAEGMNTNDNQDIEEERNKEDIDDDTPDNIPDVNEEESLSVDNNYDNKLDDITESSSDKEIKQAIKRTRLRKTARKYKTPPLYLLKKSEKQKNIDKDYLKETAQTLQSVLAQFGVGAKVTRVTVGPTVTRYELLPSQGVRVKKFIELQDDIKLAMAATDIRIEAPIPGKSAVGIEVPNRVIKTVLLGDLISSADFRNSESKLSACIGRDIAGNNIICDISTLPHLLVAGSTGSGKSVCINSIIMSLIYKSSPEDVRLILVDPKVVELQIYNDIPHLLVPVVTDPKRAAAALNWAVNEMMRRYSLIVKEKLRDIDAYNKIVDEYNERLLEEEQDIVNEKEKSTNNEEVEKKEFKEKLPRIVIIIDEFSDLMMVASKEVENAIMRIAQLARACGIYLIIATQRPSVNVISGSIKANVPGRIAFAVSSGIDSKTILDQYGAEKLIGKGDMLYSPTGIPKPIRVQGCLVTDEEIKRVVKFIKDPNVTYDEEIDKQITENSNFENEETKEHDPNALDDYFVEAGKLIIQSKIASSGFLQRKLQIGFNRASRILDQLAENGVVTEQDGKKPREILMELDEFLNTFDN